MTNSEFYSIVNEDLIEIAIPNSSHFSLGTSPYFAHQNGLAIDIYQELNLENYQALSPVSGIIIKTKEMVAPKPKFNGGINKEYLTLIQGDNKLKIFKILHIKPHVKVGEKIELGELIGTTIKNGYFAPWSSPHIHLEIRPKDDAIRARGGESFSLIYSNKKKKEIYGKKSQEGKEFIPVTVMSIFKEFILARLPEELYHEINPFIGVKGNISNHNCIVDGGIPLYHKGIVLLDNDHQLKSIPLKVANGIKIGELWNQRGNFGFINYDPLKFYLNEVPIRGISLFIAKFLPLIKIIPYDIEEHNYSINSIQRLTVSYFS